MGNSPQISPFDHKRHANAFKSLNEAWLSRYFNVEPFDQKVLSNPQQEIIEQGGFIFMMILKTELIGTFAFLKLDVGIYEFSKMAVREDMQGLGYGTQLMQFALRFAEQHHWKKLLLFSNRKLENSIYLYQKFGFEEVPLGNPPYKRGNIKMELNLS